jgi:predicted metal-binding membrane protein
MTAFAAVLSLLVAVSATMTIVWSTSMSAMGGMPMPGGWTMSMMWMRMPEQTWAGVAVSFLGMWVVMMVAMMLPSLAPPLSRYRQALASSPDSRPGRCTLLAGAGYFGVWAAFGIAIFPIGTALADFVMDQPSLSRAIPMAIGVVVLICGLLQLTRWKADHLACWREAPHDGGPQPAGGVAAWRVGVRLGARCGLCCVNLMIILLVMGMMDLRVMAGVTAALSVERLEPGGERAARAIGIVIVAVALFQMAKAARWG